jgi:DNA-binding winged helix-turn-helix (wHTH) protein/tetratricopeptide (TPR) repeat protein
MSAQSDDDTRRLAPIDLAHQSDFELGGLQVRPRLLEVVAPTKVQRVEPRIMQVLVALWLRRGAVVSRDELIGSCWNGVVVGDNAIHRAVAGVRRLGEIGVAGAPAFTVATIPKVGYRLTSHDPGASAAAPPSARRGWSVRAARLAGPHPRLAGLTAAVVLFAAAYLVITMTAAPKPSPLIAALEFAVADDPSLMPFAQSLATQIASTLSENDLVGVAGRRAEAVRGGDAAALDGVELIVDGAVARRGEAIALRAHITHAPSGAIVWAHETERPAAQLDQLETQIAARVTDVLRCALVTGGEGRPYMTSEAFTLFLRACEARRFNPGDWERLRVAASALTRVAPDFSQAWSLLAVANSNLMHGAAPELRASYRDGAEAAAQRAIRLDRNNAESYLALSMLAPDWASQHTLVRSALVADNNSPDANHVMADRYLGIGRVSDALRYARRARALDPLSRRYAFHLGLVLSAAGQREAALAEARNLQRTWPDYLPGLELYVAQSTLFGTPADLAAALAAASGPPVNMSAQRRSTSARFYGARVSGDSEEIAAVTRLVLESYRMGEIEPGNAITMLSSLNQVDAAFEIAHTHAERFHVSGFVLFLPGAENMRADPRFISLASHLGWLDIWRDTNEWPDFCDGVSPPYDCRAEAVRIAPRY